MRLRLKLNHLKSRVETYNLSLSNINDKIVMFEPMFTGSSGTSFRQLHRDEGPHLDFKVNVKVKK
jgi:hypothetical protein